MTNNRKLNIFINIYLIFFILIYLLLVLNNKIPCIFKSIFQIPCPFCGLTRAFKELFKLNISKALFYNILSIPLFIFFIYWFILFIKDIIKKENKSFDIISNLFSKYYLIIIILVIISWILNIIHGI